MTIVRSSRMRDRDGSAAAIVVFALAFMGLLAVAGLETAVNEHRGASAIARSAEAMSAAEAGLNSVLGDWPAAQFVSVGVGDSLDLGWDTLPNGARYRAVIRRYDDGVTQQMRAIKVEAHGPGALGGRGVLWAWTTVPIMHLAAVNAGGNVSLNGNSVSDAYDSREGDYGVGPVYPEGHIMANGSLNISGPNVAVGGDVTVGGTTNGTTQISGTITQGATPVEYPAMPCPTGGYTPLAALPVVAGLTYNVLTGALTIPNNTTLALPTGSYYFSSVTNRGTLTIVPGAQVEIFISGAYTTVGTGRVNNTGRDPADFAFYGCGTTTGTWQMAGGPQGYFHVYAPYKDFQLTGGNAAYGAIAGRSFNNVGGGSIHFDRALLAGNHRGMILSRSWTQLAR